MQVGHECTYVFTPGGVMAIKEKSNARRETARTLAKAAMKKRPVISNFHYMAPHPPVSDSWVEIDMPEVSIPGVKNVLNTRYCAWGKLLWVAAIVSCSVGCLYQISDRIKLYLRSPVAIVVDTPRNQSLYFPLITLCPFKQFGKNITYSNTTVQGAQAAWDLLNNSPFNVSRLWKLGSIRRETISLKSSCGIGYTDCNLNFVLRKEIPTPSGTCWIIAKEDSLPITFVGPTTGLVIDISENTTENKNKKLDSSGEIKIGYTIYIHEEYTNPDPTYDAATLGQPVYMSATTTISLVIKQFQFLNTSEKPCDDGDRSAQCFIDCLKKKLDSAMDCRLPFMNSEDKEFCTGNESFAVFQTPIRVYRNITPADCHCKRKCNETVYSPNTYAIKDSDVTTTTIRIFFQDNNYEVVREFFSYSFVAFLSDLGGNLGLFMGMCLLSVLEILEICFTYAKKLCKKRRIMPIKRTISKTILVDSTLPRDPKVT